MAYAKGNPKSTRRKIRGTTSDKMTARCAGSLIKMGAEIAMARRRWQRGVGAGSQGSYWK